MLIGLRNSMESLKSKDYKFIHHKDCPRVLTYLKGDEKSGKVKIILNCTDENYEVVDEGKIIFEHLLGGSYLKPKGICILDMRNKN